MYKIKNYLVQAKLTLDLIDREDKNIEKLSRLILSTLSKDKNIFICGNGGSSAQAALFAGELIANFEKRNRKGFNVFDLHSCLPALTAWSNDFNYFSFFYGSRPIFFKA